MAKDHSFDIVSKADMQEVRNAIQVAQKEITTRFDFRGTSAGLEFEPGDGILKITGDHEGQLKNVIDIIEGKLAKRGVSTKSFEWEKVELLPSGAVKQQAKLQQGLTTEKAKSIVKEIKTTGLKVQARVDGDAVRVSGRQINDLQSIIQFIKEQDFGVPLQTENLR